MNSVSRKKRMPAPTPLRRVVQRKGIFRRGLSPNARFHYREFVRLIS
jgi:hypothetical protein